MYCTRQKKLDRGRIKEINVAYSLTTNCCQLVTVFIKFGTCNNVVIITKQNSYLRKQYHTFTPHEIVVYFNISLGFVTCIMYFMFLYNRYSLDVTIFSLMFSIANTISRKRKKVEKQKQGGGGGGSVVERRQRRKDYILKRKTKN